MPRTDLPLEIQELFFDFHWDAPRLYALQAEVEMEQVQRLTAAMDLPIWQRRPDQVVFDLRPREVLDEPTAHPDHDRRIEQADLNYPLLMMKNRRGDWTIMDGYHRLAQCIRKDIKTVNVIRLPRTAIQQIQKP